MGRMLSPWCKSVKIALIEQDLSVAELAKAVDMTSTYTSAVINGRVISESAARVISDYLNIELTALTLTIPK
nr:MAG TPA: SOS-response transcriptional repressor [Caudoviricetes sp.]